MRFVYLLNSGGLLGLIGNLRILIGKSENLIGNREILIGNPKNLIGKSGILIG